MNHPIRIALVLTLFLAGSVHAQPDRARPTKPAGPFVDQWEASGTKGAVAGGGPEAVAAGLEILEGGGNAADAAAATLLALSVTDANAFCFGGEVPILVYDAERKVVEVIDGQGTAPRLATFEYFQKKGGIPTRGIESATVPATLDACLTTLERHGTLSFAEVVAPTLRILERGEHDWHADMARTLRTLIDAEGTATDRRQGLRKVADEFYRGSIARAIDNWARENGALIRFNDLATHVTRVEEPVTAEYRGHTIVKCGVWTQGPSLLQTLKLLEGFDLAAIGPGSADAVHLSVEALKLALADRDEYYADPHFEAVPLAELLSNEYTEARRDLIDREHASQERRPGNPKVGKALLPLSESKAMPEHTGPAYDTTTCVVADQWGNVVAATPSGWSGVLAGDTGVWLGSRLQSFNTWPDHPNRIEPGKRPRITLTPTIVLKDEQPIIAVSVAGGDGQDQVALQMLLNLIDFEMTPSQAVTAPRFVTEHYISSFGQRAPELGHVRINAEVGDEVLSALESRGHRLTRSRPPIWHPTVLRIDPASGRMDAAGDPKARRHAAAY